MGWAVAAIIVGLFSGIASFVTQRAVFDEMARQQPGTPGGFEGMMLFGMIFGVCFGLIWSWGPPIFTLVWFSRAQIKAEVASWSAPAA